MHALPLILFALTYLGLAVGRIPPLKLDRTGFAILGAVAFLATGLISVPAAKEAVDAPTLVVLFGMMLLSAQYRLSGLYGVIGHRLARVADPRWLLLGTIVVTALLSAVLTNDVICFALTPVLLEALLAAKRPPLPYLLAIACASNIGSALTPIGNPQNILIAQSFHLPFLHFLLACAVPVVLSLGVLYWLAARLLEPAGEVVPPCPPPDRIDRWQATKAVLLTVAVIGLFLSPVPPPLTALGLAGFVLTSRRMNTRDVLELVDWQLLALFVGLFIVVRGFELSGWTTAARDALMSHGADLTHPPILVPGVAVLSNVVGNVPAVMLMLPFVGRAPVTGYALALASTFAGNAVLVGSIANLIVAEQAQRLGVRITFRDHLRLGLPVTIVSLVFAVATIAFW
ncbi:MAG TPA: SLC13 family permease [Thermoanaerobaculia bacterium]|jgi:Na+/H+ antiporter NhaD/arsenite permease-like protein|nr:SLC13 family permease [Thermoanaerobaculia bacterium]